MKYGGRLSSLLDVQLKEDYTGKVRGTGGIGLISSRLMIEGGLGKEYIVDDWGKKKVMRIFS